MSERLHHPQPEGELMFLYGDRKCAFAHQTEAIQNEETLSLKGKIVKGQIPTGPFNGQILGIFDVNIHGIPRILS